MGSESGLRLGAALQQFWWTRGYLSEGRERLTALLARPQAQAWSGQYGSIETSTRDRTKARADALNGAGALCWLQSDYTAARTMHTESLEIRRELGDMLGIASSPGNLGNVADQQGNYASARSLLEESLSIHNQLGDRQGIAESLVACAGLSAEADRLEDAARLWGAAERLREEYGTPQAPNDLAAHDSAVGACNAIDKESLTSAWTEGRAMTEEQAIACANR